MTRLPPVESKPGLSLHLLGVACGLAAGAWLGAAEAPTKLVTAGFSPFLISLGMVAGVFVARWTVPMALKGTGYIVRDLRRAPHLIVWAILAGMLWAVANTLTVFAIRDVGLSIAFPLWNANSLVGLFWGWLLFNELRGSTAATRWRVVGGSAAIVAGACLLAYATSHGLARADSGRTTLGILAALGAALLWGTMYIPYRKAYISGMNPLSFVTVFTFGELGTVLSLAIACDGGWPNVVAELVKARPALFWLFLGGFCWVLGDLFQQYAAKYIGISRGIPLSNTNQIWGLAWGALVFGELAGQGVAVRVLVLGGSLVMIAGAAAICSAEAPQSEQLNWKLAADRECMRYALDPDRIAAAMHGKADDLQHTQRRASWEVLILSIAAGCFLWLAIGAKRQPLTMDVLWMSVLVAVTVVFLLVCGFLLWKRTRFS